MALNLQTFTRSQDLLDFTVATSASGWIRPKPPLEIDTGATVTIDDGSNSDTFEMTQGGGAQPGNIEVDISAATTVEDVCDAIVTAHGGSGTFLGTLTTVGTGDQAHLTVSVTATGVAGNNDITHSSGAAVPWTFEGLSGGSAAIANANIHTIEHVGSVWYLWYLS